VASLCHPWFTTTNLSYRFPIFETSATALCGTTGIYIYIYTRDYQGVSCPCPNYCHDAGRHWRCKCSLQCLSASHLQPIPGIYTSRIIPTKTDNHAQEKCLRCHMRAVLIKLTGLNALLTSVEIPLRLPTKAQEFPATSMGLFKVGSSSLILMPHSLGPVGSPGSWL
jgi:hypothetical protein